MTSPATLGRLKNFTKPYDFVLAPIVSDERLSLEKLAEKQAKKPILITRYTKNSEEWSNAIYYNVRTGKPCRVTLGDSTDPNVIPVKSYRQILNAYPYNPEHKALASGGQTRCDRFTRGILERDHVIANQHKPCGKEIKRKLDQGLMEHPDADNADDTNEFHCRVYEGKVAADEEMISFLANFSERQLRRATGLGRDAIRLIRRGKLVKQATLQKLANFRRDHLVHPTTNMNLNDALYPFPRSRPALHTSTSTPPAPARARRSRAPY